MRGPAALPHVCPPLGCLSRIHASTLKKGTDKRAYPARAVGGEWLCRLPMLAAADLDDVVRALLADGDVADPLFQRAVSLIGNQAVVELTSLVGYYATLALQLRVFRVGLPAEFPGESA